MLKLESYFYPEIDKNKRLTQIGTTYIVGSKIRSQTQTKTKYAISEKSNA